MGALKKLFGEKASVRVRRIRAGRAVFVNQDVQEIHMEFETDERERLVLQMTPRQVHTLVTELVSAYQAINPPLASRGDYTAMWEGMEDN